MRVLGWTTATPRNLKYRRDKLWVVQCGVLTVFMEFVRRTSRMP